VLPDSAFHVEGSGFLGYRWTDTGGGNAASSATNYPLLQLHRLDNDQVRWLLPDPSVPFTTTALTSLPATGFPRGVALVTVFVNGIPSQSRLVRIGEVWYRIFLPILVKSAP
jgi:hypothetical protein